ncbi:signal peptide peptidase SppA [Stappia sp. ES.058]|uniref:signal peptide peptidase SppA n=1 Tax=Stappia sp. ES.058 TaxID=1881061 RepID=UPI00087C97CA|nr:signal peptide peptidase SppA [Stappia sp. ES.058]SDU47666.1 protease-4 [Stappia sp. ES.058]
MSLDADAIVDRRRLRRKVTFWRVAAFLVTIAALAGLVGWGGGFGSLSKRSAHIARVSVEGVIVDDRRRLSLIESLAENDAVKAVIIDIDSPGGSTVGGEALYQKLRDLAEKKPVVATIGTLGASAGYMTAIAADHIVARHTSLTGAIGVYIQFGNIKGLLDSLGVKVDVVRSGPLKAEPNFFSDTPEAARENLQDVIDDSYSWFFGRVAERRKMSDEEVRKVAQGGIFSGERARRLGLVDSIGGQDTAQAWLRAEHDISSDLPVITWAVPEEYDALPFTARMSHAIGQGIGETVLGVLGGAKTLVGEGVALDGLVSVWHAQDASDASNGPGGR